jgi:acetyl esterase/lipase
VYLIVKQYLNRKTHAQKPTAHISYDEGLHLIRKFLVYASHHTVEDIQRFTAQWVPHPRWVKVDEVKIDEQYVQKSAETIQAELGHHGTTKVGGSTWWQWRRPGSDLKAEWIEMRDDYNERKKAGGESKRVMLYVHGGGYFFGSVDEHRYQMQRHARKLKARVLAPRYRLAPQFPFPCGLHDCLSAYLWLLTVQDPTTIILAGDSAGGGMVLSMLVILRNQGLPLPAGAILISPWADLTHSFPSVAGDNPLDYIPAHGFHQKPSPSWPPPNTDDMLRVEEEIVKKLAHTEHTLSPQQSESDAIQGFHIDHNPDSDLRNDTAATGTATNDGMGHDANTVPGPGHDLSILIDGNLVEIKDQIQMYATNQLISHPLVSPILQPSLGGLPPLLIMVGGGEMLRDEQIYLAHKAANPAKYPPGDAFLDEHPREKHREQITKWEPTDVQLQVWDDLCHVAPTLSFTRPAKYMYRSIAQFGAWTLARAQKTDIEITYDDDVSIISSSDTDDEGGPTAKETVSLLFCLQ